MKRAGESCTCTRCWLGRLGYAVALTGVEKAALEPIRSRWNEVEDRRWALLPFIDEDGTFRFQVATLRQVLLYAQAKMLWDEAVEGDE